MWRTLSVLSLLPLAAAVTMDAALLQQIPDAAAMKRMCQTVKSIMDSTAPKEVTESAQEYEKFVEQAKPVCKEVDTMTDKDLETFIKTQHEASEKAAETMLKQRCTEIKKAKGTPKMQVLEAQAWYPQVSQFCETLVQHPEQLQLIVKQVEAEYAEQLPEIMEDMSDSMDEVFADEENMAMGCKMIESGLNNGRMDWFEMEAWYPKALAMCRQYYGEAMDEVDEDDFDEIPDLAEVLQSVCSGLDENAAQMKAVMMEDQDWVEKAKPICRQIEKMDADELADFIKKNKPAIKLLGAAQIVSLCSSVEEQTDEMMGQAWFSSISSVCKKVGGLSHDKVGGKLHEIAKGHADGFADAITNRCTSLENMAAEQLAKAKKEEWYESVKAACDKFTAAKAVAEVAAVTQRRLRGVDVYA